MPEVPSLGRRGGGWVVLQFVLIGAALAACAWGPRWPDGVRMALVPIGVLVAVAGAAVVAAAARELGSSLTPFPRPSHGARLATEGPYRIVRHPMYSGGVLFVSGLSFALSPLALVPAALLAAVWALKSRVEERFLRDSHPEYGAYCERTRSRLVPFLG